MTTPFIMNVFSQCSPISQSAGQWRNPRDRAARGYNDVGFWVDLAKTAERGCFDSLFFADVHGVYDIYDGSSDAGIRHGMQWPGNDPTLLLALLAHETRHLGFISTYSTSYFEPFTTAKLFSSLDHFTGGRVGWNIVTSYLSSAGRNGLGEMLEHDQRYDKAEEFLEICYRLWEHSWEDNALVFDTENDTLIEPARVHQIDHVGQHYSVEGPHMCSPSPQRTPFLVQAGQSPRGYEFGSKHAEGLYVVFPTPEKAAAGARLVREGETKSGRAQHSVKLMQAMGIVVAETEREAKLKFERYQAYASVEGALALFGGWTGIDLSSYKPDDMIGSFETDQMKYLASYFGDIDPDRQWSFGDMCDFMKLASVGPVLVGDPQHIADELERWVEEGGVDGFNLVPIDQPGSLADFVDLVVPELQKRGRMRSAYPDQILTLRELYSGTGNPHLAADHPALKVS